MINPMNQDPMEAALMVMAHLEEESIKKKEKEKKHEPKKHEMGFSLSFETPEGVIGLWSCWLGDQLYIGYPYGWNVSDGLIKEVIGMVDSQPVYHKEWVRGGVYRDSERKWGKFYGEKLDGGGRVWVDHTNRHSNGRRFHYIQNERLQKIYCGHEESMSIHTFAFTYFNDNEPEAPNAKEEAIQPYLKSFIKLALEIAKRHGGITAVHAEYEFTILTPALLETEGYNDIRYLKGSPQYREGFGGTVVYAKKENEEIILKSGNSLVPWINIRKISIQGELTVEEVLNKVLVF